MSDKTYQVSLAELKDAAEPSEAKSFRLLLTEMPPETGAPGHAELPEDRRELLRFEYERAQDMLKHYDTLSWQTGNIFIAGILVFTGLAFGKDGGEVLKQGWRSLILVLTIPIVSLTILLFWAYWFKRHRGLYRFRDDVLHRLEIKLGFYHFLRVAEANLIEEILNLVEEKLGKGRKEELIRSRKCLTVDDEDIKKVCDELWGKGLCNEQRKRLEKRAVLEEAKKTAYKNSIAFERPAIKEGAAPAAGGAGTPEGHRFEPFIDPLYKKPSSYQLLWRLAIGIPLLQFAALFFLWWVNMYVSRWEQGTPAGGWILLVVVILVALISPVVLWQKTKKL